MTVCKKKTAVHTGERRVYQQGTAESVQEKIQPMVVEVLYKYYQRVVHWMFHRAHSRTNSVDIKRQLSRTVIDKSVLRVREGHNDMWNKLSLVLILSIDIWISLYVIRGHGGLITVRRWVGFSTGYLRVWERNGWPLRFTTRKPLDEWNISIRR